MSYQLPLKWQYRLTAPLTFLLFCLQSHASTGSQPIKAGFAKKSIVPEYFETWEDINRNGKKDDDEPFTDTNGNGKFDAIYLAGFQQNRPAQSVNDPIQAIATVLIKGNQSIAFVTLDLIGFMIDEVEDIRRSVEQKVDIDHIVVHSLHNHESPDTQGLWGKNLTSSGVNKDYLSYVKKQAVAAVIEAYNNAKPADIHYGAVHGNDDLYGVVDTRTPDVIEKGVRYVVFTEKNSKKPLGTWVHFANHVETAWNKNLAITADWPGYTRAAIEQGLNTAGTKIKGLGGVASVFIGNIGGLSTTLPDTPVYNRSTGDFIAGTGFDKVRAQGETIAHDVLTSWGRQKSTKSSDDMFFVKKINFDIRVTNKLFILARRLGVLDRNMKGIGVVKTKTEINHIGVGPIEILTIPGELYPEIAIGGVVNLPGSDFEVEPIETPPIYELMTGKLNLIFNLTNDSIGYIIPYSEWDEKKPYLNHDHESTYGEGNSVGKHTGPRIYGKAKDLLLNRKSK